MVIGGLSADTLDADPEFLEPKPAKKQRKSRAKVRGQAESAAVGKRAGSVKAAMAAVQSPSDESEPSLSHSHTTSSAGSNPVSGSSYGSNDAKMDRYIALPSSRLPGRSAAYDGGPRRKKIAGLALLDTLDTVDTNVDMDEDDVNDLDPLDMGPDDDTMKMDLVPEQSTPASFATATLLYDFVRSGQQDGPVSPSAAIVSEAAEGPAAGQQRPVGATSATGTASPSSAALGLDLGAPASTQSKDDGANPKSTAAPSFLGTGSSFRSGQQQLPEQQQQQQSPSVGGGQQQFFLAQQQRKIQQQQQQTASSDASVIPQSRSPPSSALLNRLHDNSNQGFGPLSNGSQLIGSPGLQQFPDSHQQQQQQHGRDGSAVASSGSATVNGTNGYLTTPLEGIVNRSVGFEQQQQEQRQQHLNDNKQHLRAATAPSAANNTSAINSNNFPGAFGQDFQQRAPEFNGNGSIIGARGGQHQQQQQQQSQQQHANNLQSNFSNTQHLQQQQPIFAPQPVFPAATRHTRALSGPVPHVSVNVPSANAYNFAAPASAAPAAISPTAISPDGNRYSARTPAVATVAAARTGSALSAGSIIAPAAKSFFSGGVGSPYSTEFLAFDGGSGLGSLNLTAAMGSFAPAMAGHPLSPVSMTVSAPSSQRLRELPLPMMAAPTPMLNMSMMSSLVAMHGSFSPMDDQAAQLQFQQQQLKAAALGRSNYQLHRPSTSLSDSSSSFLSMGYSAPSLTNSPLTDSTCSLPSVPESSVPPSLASSYNESAFEGLYLGNAQSHLAAASQACNPFQQQPYLPAYGIGNMAHLAGVSSQSLALSAAGVMEAAKQQLQKLADAQADEFLQWPPREDSPTSSSGLPSSRESGQTPENNDTPASPATSSWLDLADFDMMSSTHAVPPKASTISREYDTSSFLTNDRTLTMTRPPSPIASLEEWLVRNPSDGFFD